MNQQEITQFLSASRIALMATINRDGTPQLSPNWYNYDGEVLTFVTTKERMKYFNLQRDNRISICICQSPLAQEYVIIKGTATIEDRDFWDKARQVIRRYVGLDQVEPYVARWQTQPRILVTVTPYRITCRNP